MKKYIKTITLGLVSVSVLVLALVVSTNNAKAADASEFVYFRIDTELDVLNAKGVTVEWSCNGLASGSISETAGGIASESTQSVDGIVKVASISKEWTDSTCSTAAGGTIKAKVSIDGWITRRWAATLAASTSYSAAFTTYASQDYNIRINGVADELGTALTLNGTTASASYSGTVASQSYSNYGGTWRKFIAASTDGGTVTGGANGYVNRATTSVLVANATASTSVDFGVTATASLNNESGLLFGHKIQIWRYGSTFEIAPITSGTVTAGDSYGTTCTGSSGYWYCAVPLANTETLAKYSGGTLQTTTASYTDRSTGSGAQTLSVLTPTTNLPGADPTPTPTPTPSVSPTPTPDPNASPTPTPTPTASPTPTPTPTPSPSTLATPASRGFVSLVALGLKEGDTISAAGSSDPDIYIPNVFGYKRLFLNPAIFNFYGHLGGFRNVKNATAVTRDKMITSGLFRNCETNDPKVYGVEINGEDTGLLHWVNTTGAQAVADDANFFKKVFCINTNEFNWYSKGSNYTSVSQVPVYLR